MPMKAMGDVDANTSVFRSGLLQRPPGETLAPGSGTYEPKLTLIKPGLSNSGASMRSRGARFAKEETYTEAIVGPGRYTIREGSLDTDLRRTLDRTSKLNPAFGSRVPQRALQIWLDAQ